MKKTDLINKLRGMSLSELEKELQSVLKNKEIVRLSNPVGKSKNPSQLMVLADQVAKIKTIMTEKKIAAQNEPATKEKLPTAFGGARKKAS